MNLKDLEYRYGLSKPVIEAIVILHSLFLVVFDALLLLIPRKKLQRDKTKLLVIKLDAIGDFILWLDFARGLRELYPSDSFHMTLLANRLCTDLALQAGYMDHVFAVDRMRFITNPFYRFRHLSRFRREGFDIVIDPAFSREFQFSPPVVRISGAAERIGAQGDSTNQRRWQKRVSDQWYTRLLPLPQKRGMELVRNAEFLRQMGHNAFRAQVPAFHTGSTLPYSETGPYYVIFPGAGWAKRQWPVENFAALASLLYAHSGLRGFICGSGGERGLAARIRELTDAPLDDMTGRTTLSELAALIAGARLLVGNETSAVHLAAAVSTPAVCILGGGHFGRFVPYQVEEETERPVPVPVYHEMDCYHCNWNCIYPTQGDEPVPCISLIPLEDVWQHVQRELDKTSAGTNCKLN